ncbi:hypothetical protein [Bacillus sp. FJAT-27245]|uniref:hypothetical protein n=1 Tax=Bacillus sp. FJAT-27245 TaxID=1684144 RepID=UPI0006A7B8B8|nr:hypothetical protein [Bacillus sp. FJAT-27245]
MNRFVYFGVMGLIIIAGLVFFWNQAKEKEKETTFGEAISTEFEKNSINKIEIDRYIKDKKGGLTQKKVTITNKDTILTLLEEPSSMKLKEIDATPGIDYALTVYTDNKVEVDSIIFGDGLINIADSYFVITDAENKLEKVIKKLDLDWETKK